MTVELWENILTKQMKDIDYKFVCMVNPTREEIIDRVKSFMYDGVVQPIYTDFDKTFPDLPDEIAYRVCQPLWTTNLNDAFKASIEKLAENSSIPNVKLKVLWEW